MSRRLSLLFIILLLLSTLVEAFHFHEDGDDHPECSVCAAHHQQSDAGFSAPAVGIQQVPTVTAWSRPVPAVVAKASFIPANNRAPPAQTLLA